ncbi:DNA modification methylase [Cohnella xylanilytica]|uniref:DNA modification methylase n=1 Tax=Cohnella xylanilytica TaxID=557555 RepID=A0A841TP47_9BACL|nr:site-specific DNA-methyltransferase [Cohnella xylanilytica]MBB6689925.1 DNA modification methylase [Cohnella xylanilytica]
MDIQRISIGQINPAEYNPRVDLRPGDPEYEKLRCSIETFGYVEPIVWNRRTGNLVGGHQRFKILVDRGAVEVDVSVVDLDSPMEKALNIALNKISGAWDEEKLATLLTELREEIDISLTGFDSSEVDELLSNLANDVDVHEPVIDDGFDVQSALDSINHPETKRGEIWQLGRHLLMCGSATDKDEVARLMMGKKANLIVTDPPYNVAVTSDSERLAADGRDRIMNDDMSSEDFIAFLDQVFQRYSEIMDPAAAIYVFHPSSYQREFENAMNAASIIVRTQCVWVKNAASFGWSQYRWKHEPVFYAHLKGKVPTWYGDRSQTTAWRAGLPVEQNEPETVWEVSRGDVTKYVHPTQKPLDLLEIPIRNSSKREDLVVDFFGGSGSTLMTCEQMGRACRTMELDPIFCDVIKKRFKEATGIDPILVSEK